MWDQAQTLRRWIMEAEVRRARTIAVTSGKGGVGKSNIAVNLAIRLTKMGRRVVLLDADLGTANIDVLCNLHPEATLAHVVAGRRTLADAVTEAPGGFRLVPGASGLAQMAALSEYDRESLIDQLQELEQDADVILIDTGAGVSPNVLSFATAADEVLVVTTPEPTAVTDAYAVIKTICRQHEEEPAVRLLVNMVRDGDEGQDVYRRVDAVCRKFLDLEIMYAGHMVLDPRVPLAVRHRTPFVIDSPNCEASRCVSALAHRIDRHAAEPRGAGLLARMAGWLRA